MRKHWMLALLGLLGCDDPETHVVTGVTWNHDVLPVVQRHCLGCHNDRVGPFSMSAGRRRSPHARR